MNQLSLIEYGIHTEESNLRAHVCVNAGMIYVFPTKAAVELLSKADGIYRCVPAFQPGVEGATAMGYLVPPSDIPGCIPIATRWMNDYVNFQETDSTTMKGDKAVKIVMKMIHIGWFALPVMALEVSDYILQREGLDVLVAGKWRIQVKCDYTGGEPAQIKPRVSGNLFLQIAERNPLRRY